MAEFIDGPVKTLQAAGAIGQYVLVKCSAANTVDVAGLAEQPIGVAMRAAFAAGDDVPVRLLSACGTIKCYAAAAITVGTVVYGRASGYVDDNSGSSAVRVGVTLDAATAAGDIVEVVPCGA